MSYPPIPTSSACSPLTPQIRSALEAQCAAVPTPPTPEVRQRLGSLDSSVTGLLERLAYLTDRLQTVVTQRPNGGQNASHPQPTLPPGASQISQAIFEIDQRVQVASARINELLETIEV